MHAVGPSCTSGLLLTSFSVIFTAHRARCNPVPPLDIMSSASDSSVKNDLISMPYMILKRLLVDQGVEGAKAASSKEQLVQIILDLKLDANAIIAAAERKKSEEAELKAKLESEKARKEAERQAAIAAADAAAKLAAEELSISFASTHTPQRLQSFVEHRIDAILMSGLFSETTADGTIRMRVHQGAYTIASCERGGDYGTTPIGRDKAIAAIVSALNESFGQVYALHSDGSLLHRHFFSTSGGFSFRRVSLERLLRDYAGADAVDL